MVLPTMAFSPVDGLRNTTSYPTVPADETAAREQIQGRMDELRDFYNNTLKAAIAAGGYNYAVSAVGTDAYAVTITDVAAYAAGVEIYVLADVANTGAATVQVNALAVVAIRKNGTTVLEDGDIPAGGIAHLKHDGTYFQLQNPAKTVALTTHLVVVSTETVSGHVELATAAETTTGTDSTRAVHPAGLKVELDKKINHSLATAASDFLVASGAGAFVKKTLAEAKVILSIPIGFEPGPGTNSVEEGNNTIASGSYAHAAGNSTTASGFGSHAAGNSTTASGNYSHTEGTSTTASGGASHAEGNSAVASTEYSHAEGDYTLACNGILYNITAFDNTAKTITLNNVTGLAVSDLLTVKIVNLKAIEDIPITAINGLVVTLNTTATITSGWYYVIEKAVSQYPTHAEGYNTTASGSYSHAEDKGCVASGDNSHAEGSNTTASGGASHAEGQNTTASGGSSHAEGSGTTASGAVAHAEGYDTTASVFASHVMGQYNKALTGNAASYFGTADAFVIGNGTSGAALGNAFRVTFDGAVYGLSAFNSSGADYAEFFEWLDGNLDSEDRVGYFVTLDGDKIIKATSTDNYILGVVSVTPSVVGNNYADDWQGKYVKDDWGRIQYHDILIPAIYETRIIPAVVDAEGIIITEETTEQIEVSPERTDYVPILNPNWDSSLEYIPRENRKEWSPVGMMGKLLVRDDGTCVVNGYCRPSDSGAATSSSEGYRVLKRVSDNIIQVLFKA